MAGAKAEAWTELGYTDTDTGGIKWKDLEKLIGIDEEYNRIDRGNAFGGWEYDPETKSQNYVARSPGMQAAEARMDRRLAGEGFDRYEAPSQISSMTDALMANRMEKMGLIEPGTADLKQSDYGTRFGERSGSPTAQTDSFTPPTDDPLLPQEPPGDNPQPPGGEPGGGERPLPPGVQPGTPPPVMKPGIPPQRPNGMSEEEWMQLQAMQGM